MAGTGQIKAGAAFVELFTKDAAMVRGLRSASRKLKAFGANTAAVGKSIMAVSLIAAAPMAKSVQTYVGFSDQMKTVQAVTGATEEQFTDLESVAKKLGRTMSFKAREVAGGMAELGRAGFDPRQIVAATEHVMNLARATGTEVPRAAEIAGATLRGFQLEASEAGNVADMLAATANRSAQTLDDLGESMKYVAPFANAAGENLKDTATALGLLANNGIKGSMAGTALARAYKNLSKEGTHKILDSIGVSAVDAAGNLRPVAGIIADIGKATNGMGSAKKLAAFEEIFGRGSVGAQILSNTANFKDMGAALADVAGVAEKTATEMDSGLGGSFRRVMSAVEGAQIAIGESLTPELTALSTKITELSLRITDWIDGNRDTVASIGKIIGKALILGGVITGVGFSIIAVGQAISALAATAKVINILIGAFKLLNVTIATTGPAMGGMIGALAGPAALAALAILAYKLNQIAKEARDLYAETRKMEATAEGKANVQMAEQHRAFMNKWSYDHMGNMEGAQAAFMKQARENGTVEKIQKATGADKAIAEKRSESDIAAEVQKAIEQAGVNPELEKALADALAAQERAADESAAYESAIAESWGENAANADSALANADNMRNTSSSIFNVNALQSLLGGGGSAQERTAKATEDTARNTKRLLKNQGEGLVFG